MTDARVEKLKGCYTGVVHDVMRAMGRRNFTLPHTLRPLQPEVTLAGPAFTIEGRVDETADAHQTLLEWTGLLSKARPGHIWCCQPHTRAIANMGELSTETLHKKGVLGCVIDGALRDTDFIMKLGFPCWGTHNTPRDIVGYWLPTGTEIDIMIGEVLVEPGDWLHGDRDGMVRIPAAIVDEVIEQSVTAMQTESLVRKAILDGVDPQQAYLKYGKF
ncbi:MULTISPECIES: RraA family protein [unclassified Roseitalea]|uniref:RraA family protein n=1 Tax=unclassified Roseitalea TaxID=2639107 RepID=UPI00273EEAD3|nr:MULTISPECIES: RraA family protein [unclassified Roseitalea]